jgi:inner membrane protein
MPSSFAHAAAGLGIAAVFAPAAAPKRYWVIAAACAVCPDLDWIGMPFGNRDIERIFGGHRGFTHSITFAVLLGTAVAFFAFRDSRWNGQRWRLWVAFTLATMSHGVLDALTTQRPMIAFFSPFSTARYTFAWHPIRPIGGMIQVLGNELLWVGLPAVALVYLATRFRRSAVVAAPAD